MASLVRIGIGLLGLLGSAAACSQVAGMEAGLPIECATVQDCAGRGAACRTPTACEQGACVFLNSAEGTPSAEQTAGDCLQAVCDGAGNEKLVARLDDPPDDGNPCTLDTCVEATGRHTPQAEGACKTGLLGVCGVGVQQCDGAGHPVGECVAPAPKIEGCDKEGLDEDCDGQVNEEGAACTCGDGWVSKGEQCDDGATSSGDNCSAKCEDQRVLQVAAGYFHTCALLSGGIVKCWGFGVDGRLGLAEGAILGGKPDEMGENLMAVNLGMGRTARAITAGYGHTCALLDDGHVKCWGDNSFGQLGLGDMEKRGDGLDKMGETADEMGDKLLAVNLGNGGMVKAKAISAGYAHTCALLDDGHVKCWGFNAHGQLGLGDKENRGDGLVPMGKPPEEMGDNLPPVELGTGRKARAIGLSHFHTCALLDDGRVKCWGANTYGQLGLGDTENRGDGLDKTDKPLEDPLEEMGDNLPAVNLGKGEMVKAKAIAVGSYHTCALLDDGRVKCWGHNSAGQLGLGDTEIRGDGLDKTGKTVDEMGDNLPAVNLGKGGTVKAKAITAGQYTEGGYKPVGAHTCALLDDGSVKCWGYNAYGQLGLGDKETRGDGLDETGKPLDEMGDNLPAVNLGKAGTVKAKAIAAGLAHACALLDDDSVKCWGYNHYGWLGLGDTENRGDGLDKTGKTVDEMGNNLPTVKLYSDLW